MALFFSKHTKVYNPITQQEIEQEQPKPQPKPESLAYKRLVAFIDGANVEVTSNIDWRGHYGMNEKTYKATRGNKVIEIQPSVVILTIDGERHHLRIEPREAIKLMIMMDAIQNEKNRILAEIKRREQEERDARTLDLLAIDPIDEELNSCTSS